MECLTLVKSCLSMKLRNGYMGKRNVTRASADSGQCYGQTVPLFQRWKVSFSGHWIPHPWYANGPASGAERPSWMVFDDLGKRCNNQPCFTCVQAALCLYWHQHTHRLLAYATLRKILPRFFHVGSDACSVFFVFRLFFLARMYLFVILGGWLTEIPHPIPTANDLPRHLWTRMGFT